MKQLTNFILSNPTQAAQAAGASMGSVVLLFLVFGVLGVIDAVPLLHQALSLVALYYLYKDRASVLPFAAKAIGSAKALVAKSLPPAEPQ